MAGATGAREVTTAEAVRRAIEGRSSELRSHLFEGSLLLALLTAIGVLAWLLGVIFANGSGVVVERGLDFLTSGLSSNAETAGVGQGIFGSLSLMAIVAAVSFPLGIGAAIYLEEYAGDTWLTRVITTTVRNLAGVPSIVYGLLGLAVFVVALRELTGPEAQGRSLISGGLTMAILVLPIVIITASEALRAVPASIREAGFGVGATRWEVVRSHVLPYAAPGVLTGTILAMARAFGETAPLILVGAVTGGLATSYENVLETLQGRYTALPTVVFSWARQERAEFGANTYAAIIVLLVVLLVINTLAIVLRNRYERRW